MDREKIIDAVRDWLDGDDWKYEYDVEHQVIHMGVSLDSKIKSGKIIIFFAEDGYTVYVVLPLNGDPDNIGELLKYLTMANYGLRNGNFEVDLNDGEIRYKIFVNCDGLESLSEAVIRDSIVQGCFTVDRYGNGIAALALGFSDAKTEIDKAENSDTESTEE
ncbi:MAG: hypothetical protein IJW08_04660 [Lentisphaeria bacterium]|nr:hypothetical protein [Lentisphaeria bacterium]MBR7119656.1 hypothetical protein [Lentisphaeria bacterium]